MRRLGQWLAILAIALQAAWPLIANARPKNVHLVPLCTVDGVTHYLEVPGGKTPLDDSANAHHEHCSFCFLGAGGIAPTAATLPLPSGGSSEPVAAAAQDAPAAAPLIILGARAPPLSSVVIATHYNFGGSSDTNILAGRLVRAPYSERFMRLGLLHGRYAMEHAGSHD